MLRRVAEAPARDRPGLKAAFEAMAAGDSLLAEDMFEREVEASERLIAAASQLLAAEQGKKAEAAKNVAQLALIRGLWPVLEGNPGDAQHIQLPDQGFLQFW